MWVPNKNAFACLLVGLMPAMIWALDPSKQVTQFVFDVWTTADGLPQNSIQAINQSERGYLWFGTQEGLVRFDGVDFDVYDKFRIEPMSSNFVNAIALDKKGWLWFVNESGGLIKLRESDARQSEFVRQFGQSAVVFMAAIDDDIWVSTVEDGLFCLGEGKERVYTVESGLPHNSVWWISQASNGDVLAGTSRGLARISGQSVKKQGPERGCWTQTNRSLGGTWVGSPEGLFVYEGDESRAISLNPNREPAVYSLCEDRDGCLWVGTQRDGLYRVFGDRVEHFNERRGLPYSFVSSVFEDHEGSIWVGTDGGGLGRFRDASVTTISTVEGLPNDMVRSVLSDRLGRLWVATDGGGVVCFDGDEMKQYSTQQGLSDNRVLCINEDRHGGIWISTYGGGLNYFDGKEIVTYGTEDGLPTRRIGTTHQSRDGTVWIGTQLGLVSLKNETMKTYTTSDGLTSNLIRNIYESTDGVLWIATRGGGLNSYQDGKFTALTTDDGLSSNQVLSIYEHSNGDLWVGTSDHGLNLIRGQEIWNVNRTHGLFDDKILEILYDGQGRFWMSSNKGIFSAAVSDLYALVAGKIQRIQCQVFRSTDGMKSSECNGGSAPAGAVDRDGVVWFPTIKGVVRLDPKKMVHNENKPNTLIKEVLVDGVAIELTDVIELPATVSKLEIRYAALSLRVPERVTYRYRMRGIDREWTPVGNRRSAVYTNLDPGLFTFEVFGANDDGKWSEDCAAVSFKFIAPWYRSGWFKFLLAAGIAGLMWTGNWIRLRSMGRREVQLTNLIEQRASGLRESSRRLIDAQDQMVDAAHRAGMAELAKSVLGQVQDTLHHVELASTDLKLGIAEFPIPAQLQSLSVRLGSLENDRLDVLRTTEGGQSILVELKSLAELIPTQRRRLLGAVQTITKRFQQLNRLISAQQDFAKLERAKDQIDINQIILDALKLKNDQLHALNVEVVQDLAALPPLHGRRSLMLRALVNLIQNSCEALEESGGNRRIIRVSSFKDRFGMHIEIGDSGPGIPQGDHGQVFNQGFSTKSGHAGLGLHTTANAVAQLGGVIRVVEHTQQGTRILVSFFDSADTH